jgi:hypothetical protein
MASSLSLLPLSGCALDPAMIGAMRPSQGGQAPAPTNGPAQPQPGYYVPPTSGGLPAFTDQGAAAEPQANEFRELDFNRPVLARLADQTGGELVPLERLEEFVASLPSRRMPITETWTHPLWDQVPVYVAAAWCLLAAWALRRLRGLP